VVAARLGCNLARSFNSTNRNNRRLVGWSELLFGNTNAQVLPRKVFCGKRRVYLLTPANTHSVGGVHARSAAKTDNSKSLQGLGKNRDRSGLGSGLWCDNVVSGSRD
jgi:hypothetical protein